MKRHIFASLPPLRAQYIPTIVVLALSATFANSAAAASQIGVFRDGTWFLDTNGDNAWSGTPADTIASFGQAGDVPFASQKCNDQGFQNRPLFVVRGSSQWFWTFNDFDWNAGDQDFMMGFVSGTTFPAQLQNGLVAFNGGAWLWDTNFNHQFDPTDVSFLFGTYGDRPVTGYWGPGGIQSPGIFRSDGTWILDSDNSHTVNAGDASFRFGDPGDLPIAANFNPAHPGDEVAVFRNGWWFVDFNGDHAWNGVEGGDKAFFFGQAGDVPVVAEQTWFGDPCIP